MDLPATFFSRKGLGLILKAYLETGPLVVRTHPFEFRSVVSEFLNLTLNLIIGVIYFVSNMKPRLDYLIDDFILVTRSLLTLSWVSGSVILSYGS